MSVSFDDTLVCYSCARVDIDSNEFRRSRRCNRDRAFGIIAKKVDAQRQRLSKAEANKLSVRLELQADFYAGVWAYHDQKMKKILEPGDLESALRAANAIGDDRLQKQARGYVVPDAFTHGTSEQRIRWFRLGFETGDMRKGNTFDIPYEDL